MASRRLRKHLRKLLLVAPVIAGVGCGPSCPSVPPTKLTVDSSVHDCTSACESLDSGFSLFNCSQDGQTVSCNFVHTCSGRRPEGLSPASTQPGCTPLGAWLAETARLEAAAVYAFARAARELEAHGAPSRLIRRARGAAADEVRHARAMRAHAQRHSARAPRAVVARAHLGPRPLLALAIENAVEGCVRETFGALSAQWQARCAADAELRSSMREIAFDETNHAELSWDLKRWLDSRLTETEREQVRAAMRQGIAQLEGEMTAEPDEQCTRLAGLPTLARAKAFLDGLRAEVWRC